MRRMSGVVVAFALLASVASGADSAVSIERLPDFVWRHADTNAFSVQRVELKGLKPGMRAEVDMWVDGSGLTNGMPEASLAWDDDKGNSWVGGSGGTVLRWSDPFIEKDARGRRKFLVRTRPAPANIGAAYLYFFAKKPAAGTIIYSDIEYRLYPLARQPLMMNSAYRGETDGGLVRLAAAYNTDPTTEPVSSLSVEVTFRGVDGRERRRKMPHVGAMSADMTIDASELAFGHQEVRFVLSSSGRTLCGGGSEITRLAALPPRRVRIDQCGRTLVDGKPFFPLGMFWSENTLAKPGALERYAKSPFNCLQNYEKAMTREMLDGYWRHGLRVIASVKDVFIPYPDGTRCGFTPAGVKTREDEIRYVTEVVNRCKDHPALLAWDINDEMAEKGVPRLEERYRLMQELDPDHPTFSCTGAAHLARPFCHAYDAVGSDPYNVAAPWSCEPKLLLRDHAPVWKTAVSAEIVRDGMLGCRAQWQVPQAYAMKWEFGRPELRFPTARELASMIWQQIAVGANGILLYSYGQILNGAKGAELERCWWCCCEAAAQVRAMEDVLVKDPGPQLTNLPKRTRVRTWQDDRALYVLVCNTHDDTRRGRIALPRGNWRNFEVMFGTGVSCRDGALELEMKPIDSAIVRLER